jgi:hypothetical protein
MRWARKPSAGLTVNDAVTDLGYFHDWLVIAAYPLPRAVHFDDEIGRILQSVEVPPDSVPDVVGPYDDLYEWRSASRQPLLRLDWRGLGSSGWHVSNFFYQPGLEAILVGLW